MAEGCACECAQEDTKLVTDSLQLLNLGKAEVKFYDRKFKVAV